MKTTRPSLAFRRRFFVHSLDLRNLLRWLPVSLTLATTPMIGFTQSKPANDLIAHEWGTFTSIQGSDGELLQWNSVDTIDLPQFVYSWTRPGLERLAANPFGPLTKQSYVGLQRMETPVIYFYSKERRRVNVSVEFPQGFITEWFPQASLVGPSFYLPNPVLQRLDQLANHMPIKPGFSLAARFGEKPVTNSVIRWEEVEVLPTPTEMSKHESLFTDGSENHYFAARETDSNLLRIDSMERTNRSPEFEKFLFYRGVGRFSTPLRVTVDGTHYTVANVGTASLKHLFALEVQQERAAVVPLGNLAPAARNVFDSNFKDRSKPLDGAIETISRRMTEALVSEGLYRPEAEAMVQTWRDVWFAEPGIRILYVLPRKWTDQILPLNIEPEPRELVRVMVGRAELISPAMENELCECIIQFQQSDQNERSEALRRFHAIGLGRFAGPAIDLAIRHNSEGQFAQSARALLQAANAASESLATDSPAQTTSGRLARKGG